MFFPNKILHSYIFAKISILLNLVQQFLFESNSKYFIWIIIRSFSHTEEAVDKTIFILTWKKTVETTTRDSLRAKKVFHYWKSILTEDLDSNQYSAFVGQNPYSNFSLALYLPSDENKNCDEKKNVLKVGKWSSNGSLLTT